jgi:hypothetical protein
VPRHVSAAIRISPAASGQGALHHARTLLTPASRASPPAAAGPALSHRPPHAPGSAVPAIEWLGPYDYTAATLLGDGVTAAATAHAGRTSAVDEAAAWLRAQLAAGPRPAAALLAEAKNQ